MSTYLRDKEFLKQISTQREQEHYVRITILDWHDTPIESIEGLVTGGNISVNGNSAVRRTGSLSCVVDDNKIQATVTDISNLIAINKRAKIEIGLKANQNYIYKDDYDATQIFSKGDICYFPQGVFILSGASVQHNAQGIAISANLKDKMCLLNGECGGMFSRAMVHTPIYVYKTGETTPSKEQVLFRDLISTLVKEYSGLNDSQIHITLADKEDPYPIEEDYKDEEEFKVAKERWEDKYNKIDQIISWTGKEPLYYYDDGIFTTVSRDSSELYSLVATLYYGDAMGYTRTKFTYPTDKELTSNTGESVVSVLDKIKATLGNFEYFFDINGEFWFQPIANFQNKGLAEDNLTAAIKKSLSTGFEHGKPETDLNRATSFDFSNLDWVTAVTSSPKYEAIKNDLSITGVRGDNKQVIQYHLIFENPDAGQLSLQAGTFTKYTDSLGVERIKYGAPENDTEIQIDIRGTEVLDYRTKMYLGYISREATGNLPTEPEWRLWGKELKEWWPYVVDFNVDASNHLTSCFKVARASSETSQTIHNMNYWFEITDMSAYQLNVSQIGHRPKSINNDKVNVIFQSEPPRVFCVVASTGETPEDRANALKSIAELNRVVAEHNASNPENPELQYQYTQVPAAYGNTMAQGIAQNSAYDTMRSMVHSVIQYNEGLSITILPLYFLEPNTLIMVKDEDAGIFTKTEDEEGNIVLNPTYYEIKSYSVPLTSNGTMSLSCVRATTLI